MQLQVYTVIFLVDETEKNVLLLKRASWKSFGADHYTGVGGHAEFGELEDVTKTVFRELEEETTIKQLDVSNLSFRGTILAVNRDDHSDHLVYYYLGKVDKEKITDLSCNEGTLEWVSKGNLSTIPFVHTVQACYQHIFDDTIKRFSAIYDETDKKVQVKITK